VTETSGEPETRTVFAYPRRIAKSRITYTYKCFGDGWSGSRTGPEVMTSETAQLALSVRPDFGCVLTDKEEWHECKRR
jgi:hypothetical protein